MLDNMDGLTLLDNSETEQLYRLCNEIFNTVILVCNDEEFCLEDWQSNDEPETLAEAADYNWLPLATLLEWHLPGEHGR
jgi:hypothetical protein